MNLLEYKAMIVGSRWHDQSNIAQDLRVKMRENYINSPHNSFDRISRPVNGWQNLTRSEVKSKLKAIGKMLSIYKQNDDEDGALSFANGIEYGWRNRFDSTEIFENLFGGDYFICNDCDIIERMDDGSTCYDDYQVCQSCIDNYRYSDSSDTYITHDDWHDENGDDECDDEDHGAIGSYHSSQNRLGKIPSSFDKHKKPIYLGLELEMEIKDEFNRHEKAEQLLNAIGTAQIDGQNHTYALCEGDGSLNHGFEMVTGYTGLDTHAKQLEFFKTPFRGAKSHDTRTCGLHVHICKSDMSMLHCAKMILFVNESANQKLIRAIARRDGQHYAKIHNKKASYDWLKGAKDGSKASRIQRLNGDRYEALNFQNPKTIEFRIFKGTLKYESIMASLEFAYATWWFCKDTGTNDLTIPKFLEFICEPENKKHTRFLRGYLKEKGFALPVTGIIKMNPRFNESNQVKSVFDLDTNEI